MLKHVVLFRMRGDAPNLQSELEGIKGGLEALVGKVPTLKSAEAGINCNPKEQWQLSLIATFDNAEGLAAYAVHTEHVTVNNRIKAIMEARACADYEV